MLMIMCIIKIGFFFNPHSEAVNIVENFHGM